MIEDDLFAFFVDVVLVSPVFGAVGSHRQDVVLQSWMFAPECQGLFLELFRCCVAFLETLLESVGAVCVWCRLVAESLGVIENLACRCIDDDPTVYFVVGAIWAIRWHCIFVWYGLDVWRDVRHDELGSFLVWCGVLIQYSNSLLDCLLMRFILFSICGALSSI